MRSCTPETSASMLARRQSARVAKPPPWAANGRPVSERRAGSRVGVEVVVEVDAVDVVAVHHVHDQVGDERPYLRQARVVVEAAVLAHDPVRVLPGRVGGGEALEAAALAHPEGVEPRVQGEVALVRLGDGERERVVSGVPPLRPREPARPGLVRRRPHGVRSGTYLEDHRVEVQADGQVEPSPQLGLLAGDAQPRSRRPVDVLHARDPHRAEVVLGEAGLDGARSRRRQRDGGGGMLARLRVGAARRRTGDQAEEHGPGRRPAVEGTAASRAPRSPSSGQADVTAGRTTARRARR